MTLYQALRNIEGILLSKELTETEKILVNSSLDRLWDLVLKGER